jgi:hypothetical protein
VCGTRSLIFEGPTSRQCNHEEMMWQACNRPVELNWWIDNGGDTTLASYRELGDGADISTIVVPRSHLHGSLIWR